MKLLCSKVSTAFHHQTTHIEFLKLSATDNVLLLEPEELFKCTERGQNTAMKASEATGTRTFRKVGPNYLESMLFCHPNNQRSKEKQQNGGAGDRAAEGKAGNGTCFSVASEGHPWMCLTRFSSK